MLGGVEWGAGKVEAVLRHCRRGIELLPKAAYPLVSAGEVEAQLGNAGAAAKLFHSAMEMDPKDAEAPNHLGMLAAREGRNEEAKAWFEKAITLRREHPGAVHKHGGLVLAMVETKEASPGSGAV